MNVLQAIIGIIGLFVQLPIALYLQYKILQLVKATDVMWLLFWVNVPLMILFQIITKLAEASKD